MRCVMPCSKNRPPSKKEPEPAPRRTSTIFRSRFRRHHPFSRHPVRTPHRTPKNGEIPRVSPSLFHSTLQEDPVNPTRRVALVTGVLFIITFAASIPGLHLYAPLLNNPNYIISPGADSSIFCGAVLELITAFAGIGTAVTLFSTLQRENEGFALGYVAARTLEAAIIIVGIVSLLSVVTLRQSSAGGVDVASLLMIGRMLVVVHNWTFLLGPGLMPGVNGVLLGYLMYRSALVPRPMAWLGLIGGPMLCASAIATMFGLYSQISVIGGIVTLPIFAWELSLGIWLVGRGFSSPPLQRRESAMT
jgi:hypothetical protein